MTSKKKGGGGYKNPPKHSQFKPGKSGNPRGRPQGSKNLTTIIHCIANETVAVRDKDGPKSIRKIEAICMQLMNKALSGDLKATEKIFQWH